MALTLALSVILVSITGLVWCELETNRGRRTQFVKGHTTLHLRRGSTAAIRCNTFTSISNRSRSLDGVRWYRNGKPLILANDFQSRFSESMDQGRYMLSITNVDKADQGTYTCTRRRSKGTILAVGDKPEFVVGPRSVELPRGTVLEVKCFASGTPEPNIRIFQDEQEITRRSKEMLNGRAVNISVYKAMILACQASNVHGASWKNATLLPRGVSNVGAEEDEEGLLPLILGGVVGFLAVLFFFLVAVWLHLRRSHASVKLTQDKSDIECSTSQDISSVHVRTETPTSSVIDLQCRELEVSRNQVELGRDLVLGADYHFYHGYLHSERQNGGTMPITVKILQKHTSSRYIQKEILLLRQLHNHYILRLTATCTESDPQIFVFEYCGNDNLKSFLRNRNPKVVDLNDNVHQSQLLHYPLGLEEKLQMAWQICQALWYLASNNYVHKDLATRNCLVSETMVIKLSDIGLGLESFPEDYNIIQLEENSYMHLPLRWTAPESITDLEFTFKSTTWSFGVLLWEIFSYARQPFFGLEQDQVMQRIRDGHMIPRPHKCPRDVYAIMKSCWNRVPECRPSFATLESQLRALQGGTQV